MSDPLEHDRHTDIHRQIAAALAELVPDDPSIPPHPYLRRHLAEHAAHGQVLDDAHVPPALLPWESSLEVRRLLANHGADEPGSRWLQAWARLEPFSRNVDPLSRATSLNLAHHKVTAPTRNSPPPAQEAFEHSPVTPVWSEGGTPDNVWLVTQAGVSALTTVEGLPGNRSLVMAGDDHGLVHALHRDGSTAYAPLRVHRGKVTQALSLPGGRLVATGSSDGSVAVIDATRGQIVLEAVPRRPRTWVSSLALYKPADHTPVLLAAFSDGHVAARHPVVFHPADIRLPQLDQTSTLLSSLPLPGGDEWLLFAQHDQVYCFDGRHTRPLSQHPARIRALVALPTAGQYAVADEQGHLSVCDATDPDSGPTTTRSRDSALTSLLVTQVDGQPALLSAGADGSVCLWTLPGLDPIGRPLPGPATPVTALTCIQGRVQPRLVASAADGTVRSWPLDTQTFHTGPAHWDRINACALSSSRPPYLATARTNRISIVDVYRETGARTLCKGQTATALAWPRLRGRLHLAAALKDTRIVLTDPAQTPSPILLELHGHHLPATALVPLPDTDADLLASGSGDGTVRVWDLRGGKLLAHFRHSLLGVRCLATHHGRGGLYLASGGSDGSVRVWDARRLQQHGPTIKCGQFFVNDLAFATGPQGELLVASAGQNGTLRLWDADTADQLGQIAPHDGELTAVTALALPTGRRLFATAGRTSIHVWDSKADRRLLQIVTGEPISALKSVPDRESNSASLLLATGETGTSVFRLHHDRI